MLAIPYGSTNKANKIKSLSASEYQTETFPLQKGLKSIGLKKLSRVERWKRALALKKTHALEQDLSKWRHIWFTH